MVTVDYAHTATARRARAIKAGRLVDAAAGAGVSTCELRPSHPDVAAVRAELLRAAGVASASVHTWVLVAAGLDERLLAAASRRCSGCGAPVVEAVGQRSPLAWVDPLPHPAGSVALSRPVGDADRRPLAVVVEESERAGHPGPLHRPHHLVCPTSTAVVQRLPRSRRCPICHHALAWWVPADELAVHPACESPDPPGRRRSR